MIYDLKSKKTALIKKYWSTKFDINEQNESKIIPRIKDILEDAVKKRTSPDLQSGINLNGGIESSILLMLLKKKSTNVKTFSVKYNYNDNNTSQYAKIISDQFLTEHTEIECNATDIKNLIEAIPNYYDEPIGNSLMIPSYIISKEASNHVKEMFYSTGSDEIFGGKAIYLDYEKLIKIQNKLGLFRHFACTKYKKKNPDKAEKIKALIKEKNSKLFYVKLLSNYLKNSDETWNSPTLSEDFDVLFGNTEALNTLLSFDQNYLLPEQFLFTENRIARTFGTEHKFPFLDYRMIEFANKIEPGLKIKGDIVKYILRESYKNELSPQILKQKNIQPEVPLKQYFKNEMKTYTEEIIFDNLHHFRELNAEYIRKIWNIHQSKQSDYAPIFWNLLMLVKWHEHYIAK
jgi:asparagine synthase (glutamine-hydrolysing)